MKTGFSGLDKFRAQQILRQARACEATFENELMFADASSRERIEIDGVALGRIMKQPLLIGNDSAIKTAIDQIQANLKDVVASVGFTPPYTFVLYRDTLETVAAGKPISGKQMEI